VPGTGPVISLRRVSYAYPLPDGGCQPALADVSLEVRPGESLVVLGAGGSGKTTLALLLAGVLEPDAGEVRRAPQPPAARALLPVGLVTQNPEDSFTCPLVREEMGVVLENLDRDAAEVTREVSAMLAEVGLAGHALSHPALLSGGQKQLLALGSVLVAEPSLLVLDEPLTLLDGPGRAEVERLLARASGASVYLTSEVDEAARGERVVVLHRGRIAWEGRPGELPLDGEALAAWDLAPPDLAVLAALLAAAGRAVGPRTADPEAMARELCRSV